MTQNNKFFFGVVLTVNAILFAVINLTLPCRYETNDDVTMAWIASGVYTGAPDAHLVYINYLYGVAVAFLYRMLPGVEWYTLLFGLIHVCSSSAVIFMLLKNGSVKTMTGRVLSIAAFYLIYVYSILYLQFTTVAVICAIAGLLLITSAGHTVTGIICFALASLVRFDAAMMVGLVYAFFYPNEVLMHRTSWKKFSALVLSCFLATGIYAIDKQIYASDQKWSEFRSYNRARGIADNPLFRVAELDNTEGLSGINLLHALNFTIDEHVVSESKLREASENVVQNVTLSDRCGAATSQLMEPKYMHAVILLVMYSLSVSISGRMSRFLPSFLPCLLVVATMLVIASAAYLKYRVFLGLFLSAFVFTSVCSIPEGETSPIMKYLICGSLVLLVLLWGRREVKNFRKESMSFSAARENLAEFKEAAAVHPNTLSFVAVSIESVNPWRVSAEPFRNHVEEMWWMAKWPTHTQLRSHKDIVTNEVVLCTAMNDWKDIGEFFTGAIKYNYDLDTEPQLLFEAGGYAGVILKPFTIEE